MKFFSGIQSLSKGLEQETLVGNVLKVLHRCMGAQWLSGRVLDSRLRGCVFEAHQQNCIVSLSNGGNALLFVQCRPFIKLNCYK